MNQYSPEMSQPAEYEAKPAAIRLEFFRHDEKAKASTSGDRTGDEFVRLTPQGRINATAAGKEKNPHPEVAVAFGSPRQRSQESALRQMLANEDAITADSSLEDIRAIIDANMEVGKKDAVINDLNFDWDSNKQFHDIVYDRFLNSKDSLSFLYHDSDNLVKQLKDKNSTSYTRTASRFAKIVKKYTDILPRWREIAEQNPEKYSSFDNRMERYFGTHADALENFLMKVMDKIEGRQAVEEFLKGPKKNGFGVSEGYTVDIQDANGQPQISVTYNGKTWQLPEHVLAEIIAEGENFEKEINQ